MSESTAAALVIGNEILSGKTAEANVVVLARALRAAGISLERVVTVRDDVDAIVDEVRALSKRFTWVFTSGGVGPTHDDVTIAAIAKAFDRNVVVHEPTAAMIREHYGDECTDGHLRMALAPEGSTFVFSAKSRWPTVRIENVFLLPGVPEAFRYKLDALMPEIVGGTPFVSRAVFVRLDEGPLVKALDAVALEHPNVEVGSYPKWGDKTYRTKVTFDARDRASVDRALEAFLARVPKDEIVSIE